MRELFKDIEIAGRKWRISKLPAQTACYIITKGLPRMFGFNINGMMGLPESKEREELSFDEFTRLQRLILSACSEILPAGPTPMFDEQGKFTVIGLEHEGGILWTLTMHALGFNLEGFFGESDSTGAPA